MKKILFLLMSALICTMVYADEIDLDRRPKPSSSSGGSKGSDLYPSAFYEYSTVSINAPYYIDSMTVVIADSNEDVIYSTQLVGFVGQQSIVLPEEVDADKYSISLYFNGICLYGLF